MIWFRGVAFPFKFPSIALDGVKSDDPLIVTTMLVSSNDGFPVVLAVLSRTKVWALLLPISTSPKSVKLFTAGELADPVNTELLFPATAKVPWAIVVILKRKKKT